VDPVPEDLNCGFLGYDAVYSGRWLPTFRTNLPPPFLNHSLIHGVY
jgi:hypothetical protein